jgi:hypothetical protein
MVLIKMTLSQQNVKLVREAVDTAGKELEGKLKPLPNLPQRNAYAHIWRHIKHSLGRSYKECDDAQLAEILSLVQHCRDNPDAEPLP